MSRELEEIVLEKTERDKLIDELTLALLYLTSFTEEGKPDVRMSWKSHDWTAMDRLVDDGFIEKPKCIRKHSRVLTNEGIEKAKELLDRIGPSLGFAKKAGRISSAEPSPAETHLDHSNFRLELDAKTVLDAKSHVLSHRVDILTRCLSVIHKNKRLLFPNTDVAHAITAKTCIVDQPGGGKLETTAGQRIRN